MGKLIINGEEVKPAKKVKLEKHKTRTEIQKLIKKKQQEQQGERPSSDQE